VIDDRVDRALALDLAAAMDARANMLGEQVAATGQHQRRLPAASPP